MVITGREQLLELAKAWPRGGRHIAQSAATIALVARQRLAVPLAPLVKQGVAGRGVSVPGRTYLATPVG